MTDVPTDRETVERLIAREPLLTSMPPQETDVARTLRALLARAEAAEAEVEVLREFVRHAFLEGHWHAQIELGMSDKEAIYRRALASFRDSHTRAALRNGEAD